MYLSLACNWIPGSLLRHLFNVAPIDEALAKAEERALMYLGFPYRTFFIDVSQAWVFRNSNQHVLMRTAVFNEHHSGTPLVLVHGFSVALGFWNVNIRELARDRPVYAFDLLGQGRSSRVPVSPAVWVESIEEWRKQVGLDGKFVLGGSSLGGYLITLYATRYPDNIAHVALVDPWGLVERSESLDKFLDISNPVILKGVTTYASYINAWSIIRAMGPVGPMLVPKTYYGINLFKYRPHLGDEGVQHMAEYMCLCNAKREPTGEEAMRELQDNITHAKPPIPKLLGIKEQVPITYIKGTKTWVAHPTNQDILSSRNNIFLHELDGTHELYLDCFEQFTKIMKSICKEADGNGRIENSVKSTT